MKKNYVKPMLVLEHYELDTSIASGCQRVISLGPEPGDYNGTSYPVCKEYEIIEFSNFKAAESPASNVSFFDSCSCYLTAGGDSVFTS